MLKVNWVRSVTSSTIVHGTGSLWSNKNCSVWPFNKVKRHSGWLVSGLSSVRSLFLHRWAHFTPSAHFIPSEIFWIFFFKEFEKRVNLSYDKELTAFIAFLDNTRCWILLCRDATPQLNESNTWRRNFSIYLIFRHSNSFKFQASNV